MEGLTKWALPTKRAFWSVYIYRCSLSLGPPSFWLGKITEILLTMLINSNASQYAATLKTHRCIVVNCITLVYTWLYVQLIVIAP